MNITITHVLELPEVEPLIALLRGAVAERQGKFEGGVLAQLAAIARDVRTLQQQFSREIWNLQCREEAVAAARAQTSAEATSDEPDTRPGATETSAGPVEAAAGEEGPQHQRDGTVADAPSPADVPQPAGEMAHEGVEHAPAPPCSPAPADLPDLTAAPKPASPTWTDDRNDLVRAMYAAGESYRNMLPRLNALPGRPIASAEALKTHVRDIGLTRTHTNGETPAIRMKGQPGVPNAGSWRTLERKALLQRDWPLGVETEVIRALMVEMPGAEMEGRNIPSWAAELHLLRPKEHLRNLAIARHRAARVWREPMAAPAVLLNENPAAAADVVQSALKPAEMLAAEVDGGPLSEVNKSSIAQRPTKPVPVQRDLDTRVTIVRNTARPAMIITGGSGTPAPAPPAPGVPAVPLNLASRDGHFSAAKRDVETDRRIAEMAPITLADALRWGVNNKVESLQGERPFQTLARVNNLRRTLGLPQFTIIPARSVLDPLPSPAFGASYEEASA